MACFQLAAGSRSPDEADDVGASHTKNCRSEEPDLFDECESDLAPPRFQSLYRRGQDPSLLLPLTGHQNNRQQVTTSYPLNP